MQFAVILVTCLLSVIVFGVVQRPLPANMLDASWAYVVDYGSTHRIPFGADLVFTYGPLGFVSSRFMLPEHQVLFTLLALAIVLSFVWGCVAFTGGARRYGLLLLPLVLANVDLSNAFYFAMPLLIVHAAAKEDLDRRRALVVLVLLAAILGLTLLIKGTMSIPTLLCLGLATIILLRRGRMVALALPCVTVGVFLLAWLALGQPAGAVVSYFEHQLWIASGYTDAMSSFGDPLEIKVFLACAALLLASLALQRQRFDLLKALACGGVLFVGFKAGFVRHDAHALISVGTLVLVAFLAILDRPTILRCVAGLACFSGAFWIEQNYIPAAAANPWWRMTSALQTNAGLIGTLLERPGQFASDFTNAKREMAEKLKLPPTPGTVDLYSYEQTMLLVSDRDYAPRPVIQSYSAYTPDLAALNTAYIEGTNAPRTVFFAITPIDERYPALEDGPSWPALLSRYKNRLLMSPSGAADYAVLDRSDGAPPAPIGPAFVQDTFSFDKDIPVPDDPARVWATVTFKPTLLGRLVSLLWKLPSLTIEVTYRDGHTSGYRMVAGMAAAGFLLSPTVSTAREFVSLRASTDVLLDNRVRSFKLKQNSSHSFWGTRFDVSMAELRVPPDHDLDRIFSGTLDPGPPISSFPNGGDCIVETLDNKLIDQNPTELRKATVLVTGWAMMSSTAGVPSSRLRLAFTPVDGGDTAYTEAARFPRPDVDAYFHLSRPTDAGFSAQVDLRSLHGQYDVKVVEDGPGGTVVCSNNGVVIER